MIVPFLYDMYGLLYNRIDRIFDSLHANEECLGTTKLEEHIRAYWHMVLVVSNIEIHDFLVLALIKFLLSQAQATIFYAIVGLDGFLATKLNLCRSTALAIYDREIDHITLFPVGRVETAGT